LTVAQSDFCEGAGTEAGVFRPTVSLGACSWSADDVFLTQDNSTWLTGPAPTDIPASLATSYDFVTDLCRTGGVQRDPSREFPLPI